MLVKSLLCKTTITVLTLAPLSLAGPAHAVDETAWQRSVTANQVVLVTARSTSSTSATLRTFARQGSDWVLVQQPIPVFLGRSGLIPAQSRKQSSGTTPMGTFNLTSAFGRSANPGAQLPYVRVDRNDAWTYNPKVPSTYNLFQSATRSWKSYGNKYVEHLWALGPQYDYVVVTDFNKPPGEVYTTPGGVNRTSSPADTKRGGGIFLHVSKGIPTVGCISMAKNVMRSMLTWLDPKARPVVIIGLEKTLMKSMTP
jgi:L,D-peptidoglycan transpeptidase YkuD (ErfK/YbiS/YcfS/YnhG family)